MPNKFAIVYFTGTNNSQYLATRIASFTQADLFNMVGESVSEIDFSVYEGIGIVVPVYCGGIPNFAVDFISKTLGKYKNKYHFCILNYGGNRMNAETVVTKFYADAGLNLTYYNALKMPENCNVLFSVPSKDNIQKVLNAALEKLPEIADDILKQRKSKPAGKKFYNLLTIPFYNFLRKHWKKASNKFNLAGCNRCGLCVKECPTKNIKFRDSQIFFGNDCEFCLRCLNICPRGALSMWRAKINGPRYFNTFK